MTKSLFLQTLIFNIYKRYILRASYLLSFVRWKKLTHSLSSIILKCSSPFFGCFFTASECKMVHMKVKKAKIIIIQEQYAIVPTYNVWVWANGLIANAKYFFFYLNWFLFSKIQSQNKNNELHFIRNESITYSYRLICSHSIISCLVLSTWERERANQNYHNVSKFFAYVTNDSV